MKWHFKLIKSSVALAFTSVLLASAVVAFFVKNTGFGWFSSNKQVAANGIRVEMAEAESPVVAHRLYKVIDAKIRAEGGDIFHRYAFLQLTPQEIAEMDLGNYSMLEAPTYHLLMHISLDKDVKEIYVDTQVDNGKYELVKANVPGMVIANQALGLCSAVELFALESGKIDSSHLYWDDNYQITDADGNVLRTEDVMVVDSLALPTASEVFPMTDSGTKVTFTGKTNAFHVNTTNLTDVDDDGYKDLFIFMTYSTQRVNLLQDYAAGSATAMGDNMISFRSDFSFFVREEGN